MTRLEFDPIGQEGATREARHRPPPKQIRILLPVWGARYVELFLNYSLPTLLAPGNVPTLAAELPCRFIVMTRAGDGALLRQHPAWKRLESLCPAEIRAIDDLITGSNHSTTITLAYLREVMAAGAAKRDTCFFFLVSDYIVADGSLASILTRMKSGASGVLTTNMQAVDDALEILFSRLSAPDGPTEPDTRHVAALTRKLTKRSPPAPVLPAWMSPKHPVAVFRPRDLVSFALEHLHPTAIANMVDFPACHNAHTNRLFWRADRQTLIGRFFLMHMLCIRPEADDFSIGSSCDYSFIPEMCPSGNVEVMTDSDEYLVLEFQPRPHEQHFLAAGPITPRVLAASLEEWATAEHRDNSRHAIVYHAAEIGPAVSEVVARSQAFIAQVNKALATPPVSHRDHPYWERAIAAHRLNTGELLTSRDLRALREMHASGLRDELSRRLERFRGWLIGWPLDYRVWQPRWLDYVGVGERVRGLLGPAKRFTVISRAPFQIAEWCSQFDCPARIVDTETLLAPFGHEGEARPHEREFDLALLILGEHELYHAKDLPGRVLRTMKSRASVFIVIINQRGKGARGFNKSVSEGIGRLHDIRLPVVAIRYVRASGPRVRVQRAMEGLAQRAVRHPKTYGLFAMALGPLLALASLILNQIDRERRPRFEMPRRCSSVCVELLVDHDDADVMKVRRPAPAAGVVGAVNV